jgi:hypothetical protein
MQRREIENRKEISFTLYSDGHQSKRASGTADAPPDGKRKARNFTAQ